MNFPIIEQCNKHLEEKQEELTKALEEQEKKKKAKKKNAPEEPEVDPKEYKYLPKELLIEMLKQRLETEDCNAGVIFDNLESEYWPDLKFALELICDTVPT